MVQRGSGADPRRRGELRRMGEIMRRTTAGDTFYSALEKVATDEMALAELKANPRAYLQEKARVIPAEASVEFIEGPPWGIRLSLAGEGGVRYTFEAHKTGSETDPIDRAQATDSERQVHESVMSDAFLDAVDEAESDERVWAAFKANPKAHLQGKGISIPEDVFLEATERSPHCYWWCWTWWCFRICIIICC